MIHERTTIFLSREHAAQKLIYKLSDYKNKNCCVVAISNGAALIGFHVARRLNGELVFMPSEEIKDPADSLKSIGVVNFDYSMTDEFRRDIPQDYIYRQTLALRSELLSRYRDAYSPIDSKFQDRIVIVIDDLVQKSDEMLGCLRAIRQQQPEKIIVAVPVIARDAADEVVREADSVIFIRVSSEDSIRSAYMDFDDITDQEVGELMNQSNKTDFEKDMLAHRQTAITADSTVFSE